MDVAIRRHRCEQKSPTLEDRVVCHKIYSNNYWKKVFRRKRKIPVENIPNGDYFKPGIRVQSGEKMKGKTSYHSFHHFELSA